jgi:hypothetical protein
VLHDRRHVEDGDTTDHVLHPSESRANSQTATGVPLPEMWGTNGAAHHRWSGRGATKCLGG